MNYSGSDKKFRVTSLLEDFSLAGDNFEIVIKNRYGQVERKITKNDCFWDSEGRWYFTIENVKEGTRYACFIGAYEDDDYDKQQRVFTDIQKLYEVDVRECGCQSSNFGHCKCEHKIRYEEVWSVSIDGEDYLCDVDGRYILTADNKRICFKNPKAQQIEDMGKVRLQTMTGDEFKQFIEGHKPNGEIDTLPEMLDAAKGISDEETIHEHTVGQMEEHDADNEATDADIDSIFDQGASTAPTVPTQPLVVEEEEEP